MADISDVYSALLSVIAGIFYPSGQPTNTIATSPVTGTIVRYYPGWPQKAQLDQDLGNNVVNISVFAPPGTEQNTTRFPRQWQVATPAQHTLTATVDDTGTIITIGGTVSTSQNVAAIVNGTPFVYQSQASDTLSSVASGLAALIAAGGFSASASGAAVTISGAKSLVARVGGIATMLKEVRRQNRLFQISFWCPTPALRDTAVKAVDPVLAATNFLSLADGSMGRLIYQRTFVDDAAEKAGCYRRDLFYAVEYGTTITEQAPEAVAVEGTIQGSSADFSAFTQSDPPSIPFEA